MDSLRIFDDRTWYRFSGINEHGKKGGGAIDFVMEYGNMSFSNAVLWLLDFQQLTPIGKELLESARQVDILAVSKKELLLPEPNENNRNLFGYLHKTRGISIATIEKCLNRKVIYESKKHHNIIFCGKDSKGIIQFASMRGTYDKAGYPPFKCDVVGSDKRYGVNLYREGSQELVVVEGGIDMLSYLDLTGDRKSSLLVLGMVSSFAPLDTFLQEHPEIETIIPALDHDIAGYKATEKLLKKYKELGKHVTPFDFLEKFKDLNEQLLNVRLKKQKRKSW